MKPLRALIRRAVTLLVVLLGTFGPMSALASDKCPTDKLQLDRVTTPKVSLGKKLTLHVAGLAEAACDVSGLRLRLDGAALSNAPQLDNLQNGEIAFLLERLDGDRDGWVRLMGSPPLSGSKSLEVALETQDKSPLPHAGAAAPTVKFVIFTSGQMIIVVFVAAVLLLIAIVAGSRTALLRDPEPTIAKPTERTFSLGRCQMAFWFVLLTISFLTIWTITWDYNGILTSQSLVLLGISGTTALGAVSIDASKVVSGAGPKTPLRHVTFFDDLLTDANGLALQRMQVFIWTLVLGVISVFSMYRTLSLPAFDETLLAMAGISSGLYIGFKWPEAPTPGPKADKQG